MKINKKIVLITSGQPSSNPRIVKEATTLFNAGYTVTVVYNFWVQWADNGDEKITQTYPGIKWICVGGHPIKSKYYYLLSRLRFKLYKSVAKIFKKNIFWQEKAVARCFPELKKEATKNSADLYIAHNLGALAPAAIAAKKNNAKYAFDAEDYHRGESGENTFFYNRAKLIEDNRIPAVAYLSAASPLIAQAYHKQYPLIFPVLINNVFSRKYLAKKINAYSNGDPLKLFWFSQTVGADRGLEDALKAMGILQQLPIELTILGECSVVIEKYLKKIGIENGIRQERLIFKKPVLPDDVFEIASQHHIGLALENAHTYNRDICLTNKIFVYLLSGLSIVATGTKGQMDFLNANKGVGEWYRIGDFATLTGILKQYIQNPDSLQQQRLNALHLAEKKQNWEEESQDFLTIIKNVID